MPVDLDAEVSGSLQFNVTGVGEDTDAGELLGRIDDPELVATLNQANAQLNEATAAALAASPNLPKAPG